MTIVLHWWYLPILCAVVGSLLARFTSKPSSGYGFDVLPPLFFIAGIVLAIGITVGHFLS